MENSFQTSFIPKKPILTDSSGSFRGGGKTTSISMVVSVFILVVMLLSSGGLFLYKNYLVQDQDSLSSSLLKVRSGFDKDTIAELEIFDKRSTVVKQILDNHIVLSPLFELINELTLTSIQYTKFDHNTINGVFSVRMSGIARDYRSIALQADVFNTNKGSKLKDVIFSNLTKDKNNYVTFDLEFNIDPSLLAYSNNITNTVAVPVTTVNPAIIPNPTNPNIGDSDVTPNEGDLNNQLQETVNTTQ